MKKYIPFFLLGLFLLIPSADAAIIYVQGVGAAGTTSGTTTNTFASVTQGDLLFSFSKWNSNSVVPTLSDSQGNTWTRGPAATTTLPGGSYSFYAFATSTGADTITLSSSSGLTPSLLTVEFSGISNSSPIDGSGATNNGNSGVTACSSPTITTTVNGDLIIGSCIQQSANGFGLTYQSGFSPTASTTRLGGQYMVQTTAGAVSSTITVGTADGLISLITAFKAASNPTSTPDVTSTILTVSGALNVKGAFTVN